MDRVNKLKSGEINMSTTTRELKMQIASTEKKCVYCESLKDLTWDHIVPQSKCSLDTADNIVLCNLVKKKAFGNVLI